MPKNTPDLDQVYQSIQRIFPCESGICVPLDDIIKKLTPSSFQKMEKPFVIRICGQSGSGKSSQLLPALEESLSKHSYIPLSVRLFAPFHPNFKQITRDFPPSMMREKTNGFALKALFEFYRFCVENGYNILFDMTLLEPEIDAYMMQIAKENGYKIHLHILSVPKKVSDKFIQKRQKETGRAVLNASADYFFKTLPRSLKNLQRLPVFDPDDTIYLWSHRSAFPVKTSAFWNPSLMKDLNAGQSHKHLGLKDEKTLLKTKKKIIRKLVAQI